MLFKIIIIIFLLLKYEDSGFPTNCGLDGGGTWLEENVGLVQKLPR